MGTWNTKIKSNDTFQDVYQNFFELYNEGQNPAEVSKQIQDDFAAMFNDEDDRINCLFALALALWETKSEDQQITHEVRTIIETEADLALWRSLGADEKTIEKRKKELDNFLSQISIPREKPKRRARKKFDFQYNQLLSLSAPDGNKNFEIIESFVNGAYTATSSGLNWHTGGSGIFSFESQGKFVTASWKDSQTLEIRHDQTIQFTQKKENFFFCGDQGVIRYIAE